MLLFLFFIQTNERRQWVWNWKQSEQNVKVEEREEKKPSKNLRINWTLKNLFEIFSVEKRLSWVEREFFFEIQFNGKNVRCFVYKIVAHWNMRSISLSLSLSAAIGIHSTQKCIWAFVQNHISYLKTDEFIQRILFITWCLSICKLFTPSYPHSREL